MKRQAGSAWLCGRQRDSLIRKSGVEPSNGSLIGKMRQSIENLASTLKAYEKARALAKTGALAGAVTRDQSQQAQPQQPAAPSAGASIADMLRSNTSNLEKMDSLLGRKQRREKLRMLRFRIP